MGTESSDPEKRPSHKTPDGDPAGATKQISKRIAIVEDEEDLRGVLAVFVKTLGYSTEFVAEDGGEIVKAISDGSAQPDLILMDHRMRGMNGLDAVERIRKIRPDVKIVITSADDSVKERVALAGCLFLQKPFSKSVLDLVLSDALK